MLVRSALAALLIAAAGGARAEPPDLSGDVKFQARWYPESPAFPEQRSHAGGLVAEPSLYWETAETASVTVTPMFRFDSADPRRTQADLREAYILMYGDWDENSWEFRLGFDQVFWGVAELNNLVDIINQIDQLGHPRDRPKLGQPMAHLTISGDWGVAESFLMPYHRARTFPARTGRHRSGAVIGQDALYESDAEEYHPDLAFRYSNAVGLLDVGLTAFAGTSREPSFVVSPRLDSPPTSDAPLVPYYEQIRQFGIDAQLTTDPWLYKMEAVHRSGARNLLGREQNYAALNVGLERTFGALFGSVADLTLLAEWHYDARGSRATALWANDLFVMGVLALNDVSGTEIVAGVQRDLRYDSRVMNLELKRRLSARWTMRLEAIVNLSTDRHDLAYDGRRDSFLGVEFALGL